MVDDKAGFGTRYFFYVFSFNVIDFYFFLTFAFGVVGSQASGFLEGLVGEFFSFGFDNDVGAGESFGMEPPVAAVCELEGDFFVLEVVFSHVDIETVSGAVVEGFAFIFDFFLRGFSSDIAGLDKFFL